MKIKKKIGLIGVGNMGTSIMEGLLVKKLVKPDQIFVYDKISEKASDFSRQWKVRAVSSNAELARRAEIILLAIKPQDLAATASEFGTQPGKDAILISILAGTPIKKVKKFFGTKCAIVRAMPNLGAKVGESLTVLSGSPKALSTAQAIFLGCGKTVVLEEKHFDLVTALSGSGPAYVFLMIEAMAQAGEQLGLSPETAMKLARQTIIGAGALAQAEPQNSARILRESVTSPNGTTAAALAVLMLDGAGLKELMQKALRAANDRAKELNS